MDYKQIDSIVEHLENKHKVNSSGESKEILAVTRAYRNLRKKLKKCKVQRNNALIQLQDIKGN